MDKISGKQIKELMALQKQVRSKIIAKYGTKVLKKRPKPSPSFDEELERAVASQSTNSVI